MRILGIDPGYATIGYGIVDFDNSKFKTVNYGAIITKPDLPFAKRLEVIYRDVSQLINDFHPNAISIEKLFFNTNTTTAIDVAQARGVILLAAQMNSVEIYEYTPLQVKSAVTGFGRAEKHQVMEMTKALLSLKKVPKPDDTADALALAICHAYTGTGNYSKLMKGEFK